MKKLFTMFFVALLSLTLIGCGDKCEECDVCAEQAFGYGVGYASVHGHYVGVAKVVVDEDDQVVAVDFEEYYLPYSWAQVTPADPLTDPVVTQIVVNRGKTALVTQYYAKYLSIDGVLFTATVTGVAPVNPASDASQTVVYSATGVADLDVWVENPANAKSYVEAVEAGLVFIADAAGAKHDLVKANANAALGFTKSATGYWTNPASYPLGWGGNMKAIADALVGTTFDTDDAEIARPLDEDFDPIGPWEIGDIVTGATLSDFMDYYNLAKAGYEAAVASKE